MSEKIDNTNHKLQTESQIMNDRFIKQLIFLCNL